MYKKLLVKKWAGRQGAARIIAAAVVLFIAVWGVYALVNRYSSVKRLAAVKKADLKTFTALSSEYISRRAAFDLKARKAFASPGERSAVAIVEEIGGRAGLKERITTLKATADEETLGYMVRSVEVKIEKVDLNGLVNLLYMIEENRLLLVINEFSVKSRFDDPKLLDVRLKLSHLSKRPA